ncbi:MAG TPA: hypothetical protein VM238_01810 [Phycisphaerae bacterium]|nr:hypothetical protein [Phycisphaerae bacterium]
MAETRRKLTPRDVWREVWRHRCLFVLGAAAFAITVPFAAPYIWTPEYTGKAIFELRMDPASEEPASSRAMSLRTIQSSLQNELHGRNAVAQAAEELGLTRGFGPEGNLTLEGEMAKQDLLVGLMEAVRVAFSAREEGVFYQVALSFTHKDRDLAASMPNTLVTNYFVRVGDRIAKSLSESREFLEKRAGAADARLTEVMRQKTEFEQQYSGMQPDDPGALQERMWDVDKNIDMIHLTLTEDKQEFARLKAVAERLKDADEKPTQVVKGRNPELDLLKRELRGFEAELDEARTIRHMTDKHPRVQTLCRKIEELKKEIEQTPEEVELQKIFGPDGLDTELALQLATAGSKVDSGTRELERLQQRQKAIQNILANYAPIRQRWEGILKELDERKDEKDRWQSQLTGVTTALVAEAAKRRTRLETVQLAERQFRPSSPTLLKVLGSALAGGLAFGAALVFLAKTLDHAVSATHEADEHFGLPVCGVIGEILMPWQRRWRAVRGWLLEPAAVLILVGIISLGSLNSVLWLRYPEQYEEWKGDWMGFVVDGTHKVVDKVQSKLREQL